MGVGALGSAARTARTVPLGVERPLAVGVITAAIAFAALTKGAFYDHDRALLLGLVALPALVLFRPWRRPRVAAPQLAALALGVSAAVSGIVNGRSRAGLATAALLLAAAVLVESARRLRPTDRAQLADALVWLGAGVGLIGWWAVAVRWWPYALPDQGLWRAATTFTYANASAPFLVPLFLVAVVRPGPVLIPYALLVSVGATQSRGGVLALALGAVVLLAAVPKHDRATTFTRLAAAGAGAAVAVTALLPLTPLAAAPNTALAVIALGGGALLAHALAALPVRALLAMAGVAAVLTVYAVVSVPTVREARAGLNSQDRVDEAVAAFRTWQQHPLLGAGAGIDFTYIAGDGRGPMRARFAHNEYLQLLAEQGLLGAVALAAGAAATGRALSRARHRLQDVPPPLWAGCVAALAAFFAHSALDFIWHIPALPLLAAALLGLALPRKELS